MLDLFSSSFPDWLNLRVLFFSILFQTYSTYLFVWKLWAGENLDFLYFFSFCGFINLLFQSWWRHFMLHGNILAVRKTTTICKVYLFVWDLVPHLDVKIWCFVWREQEWDAFNVDIKPEWNSPLVLLYRWFSLSCCSYQSVVKFKPLHGTCLCLCDIVFLSCESSFQWVWWRSLWKTTT